MSWTSRTCCKLQEQYKTLPLQRTVQYKEKYSLTINYKKTEYLKNKVALFVQFLENLTLLLIFHLIVLHLTKAKQSPRRYQTKKIA